jgi:hypothetical protein
VALLNSIDGEVSSVEDEYAPGLGVLGGNDEGNICQVPGLNLVLIDLFECSLGRSLGKEPDAHAACDDDVWEPV